MKKLLTITALFLCSIGVQAQSKIDTFNVYSAIKQGGIFNTYYKPDTIPVIAYCLIDTSKLIFKWRKLYAIRSFESMAVNFNGLMIYSQYLMSNRKTPVKFKVIYSINK